VTTQPGKTQEELSPLPLMRILGDFANSQTLDAALEYDFFTLIHKGLKRRTKSLAKPGPHPRATRIVLDGLIALALIEKKDGRYHNIPIGLKPRASTPLKLIAIYPRLFRGLH
jgi:hypothetical protein